MVEAARHYPAALASGPAHGYRGVRDGLAWSMSQVALVGGRLLVVAPHRRNLEEHEVLGPFIGRPDVDSGMLREQVFWPGGPVLAAWPTRDALEEIAAEERTRALCVVPWASGETDAWVNRVNPLLLGPAEPPQHVARLDPVVIEALAALTVEVAHRSQRPSAPDRRDTTAVLRVLHDAGYPLPSDDVYAWALSNGWPPRGAELLREVAADLASGARLLVKGISPFGLDSLDKWERRARPDDPLVEQ